MKSSSVEPIREAMAFLIFGSCFTLHIPIYESIMPFSILNLFVYISLKKDLCFFSFPLLGPNKLTCEKEGTKEKRPPYLHLLSSLLSPPTSPSSSTKLLLFPQVLAFNAHLFPSYYKYFSYLPTFSTPHNQVFHTTSIHVNCIISSPLLPLHFIACILCSPS